jgi:polysaccharide export outer membrane protein
MKTRLFLVIAIFLQTVLLAACAQRGATVEEATKAGAQPGAGASQDAAAMVPQAPPATPEYRLGPGDVVKINVYGNPDLATETEVSLAGNISFPLVGDVKVGGMTRAQAEKAISQALAKGKFVPKAYVNMLITQYRSQQVSVVGEVNKPGNYSINRASSVTELLAMAGGITAKGSNIITVIQKDGSGGVVRNQVDVKKLFGDGAGADVKIGQDDVIYVPPMPVFYIYGEVRQPGAYPLTHDMTVRQALSVGGGLTVRGTERGIRLERKTDNGTISRRPDLDDKLRPDDVVQVPESWF